MLVVADTGAMLALLDAGDRHHAAVRSLFKKFQREWVLPSGVLAELDYLIAKRLGPAAQDVWLDDLRAGRFAVEWQSENDLSVAVQLHRKHEDLRLGLVDGLVMAAAVRLGAGAIATLDLRHFGAVTLPTRPRLLPRDA
jgi:predicted nucleic acid-binding protein